MPRTRLPAQINALDAALHSRAVACSQRRPLYVRGRAVNIIPAGTVCCCGCQWLSCGYTVIKRIVCITVVNKKSAHLFISNKVKIWWGFAWICPSIFELLVRYKNLFEDVWTVILFIFHWCFTDSTGDNQVMMRMIMLVRCSCELSVSSGPNQWLC